MARDSSSSTGGLLRAVLALAVLAAWGGLLLTSALATRGAGAVSLWNLRSLEAARGSLPRLAAALALAALVFAPLGVAAVFVFADRARRLTRALLVGFPAFVLGLVAAAVVVAVRDRAAGEETAAALQGRVAAGFRIDDFFPPGKDLPENIPDSELRARYGGVGGPLYRKYADEIERRVASADGYR
jgi:hypothetical protein